MTRSKISSLSNDTNASSHTVGYILMLSIFLVGGLSLFTVGMGVLDSGSDSVPINDATDDMQELRIEFNKFMDGSPYRSATVTQPDSSLSYGDPVTISVEAEANTIHVDPDNEFTVERDVTPINYRVQDGQVQYVNGGLVKAQDTGSPILEESGSWTVGNSSIFPILATQHGSAPSSIGSSGAGSDALLIEGNLDSSPTAHSWSTDSDEGTDDNIRVTLKFENLDYAETWKTYFEENDAYESAQINGDVLEVTYTTNRIVVVESVINVSFSS